MKPRRQDGQAFRARAGVHSRAYGVPLMNNKSRLLETTRPQQRLRRLRRRPPPIHTVLSYVQHDGERPEPARKGINDHLTISFGGKIATTVHYLTIIGDLPAGFLL